MKYLLGLLFILTSGVAKAQKEIKIEDAKKYVGDTVKICTHIFGGKYLDNSKGTPTFLNAGANYPNSPLTLLIWADARKEFKNKPEEYFNGKDVCITGKLEIYKDKVEIIIQHQSQITEVIK